MYNYMLYELMSQPEVSFPERMEYLITTCDIGLNHMHVCNVSLVSAILGYSNTLYVVGEASPVLWCSGNFGRNVGI